MDELTKSEQQVHEHYARIEAENFHLKKQLQHKNREIKHLKRVIRSWKEKFDKLLENKGRQKYTNKGKHFRRG